MADEEATHARATAQGRGGTPPRETDTVERLALLSANGELLVILALEKVGDQYQLNKTIRATDPQVVDPINVRIRDAFANSANAGAAQSGTAEEAPEQKPDASATAGVDRAAAVMKRWDNLKAQLGADGITVQPIPAGDMQMSLSIDLDSGQIVGTAGPLHPYASSDLGDIESRMFANLKSMFENYDSEVQAEVSAALAEDDHQRAARAMIQGNKDGRFGFGISENLVSAAARIDLERLDATIAREVAILRFALRSKLDLYDAVMVADIAFIDAHPRSEPDVDERAGIETAKGIIAKREGNVESAYVIWKGVAREADSPPGARAWAYRNLSMLLDVADPEAAQHAKLSADAFLIDGDRQEAAKSLVRYAECVLADDPTRALRSLDEIVSWFGGEGALDKARRAGLLHIRARALLELGKLEEALATARSAAELRDGIYGAEGARAASLFLAAAIAREAGLQSDAEDLEQIGDAIVEKTGDDEHRQERVLARAITAGGHSEFQRIRVDAGKQGNWRLQALAQTLEGNEEPDIGKGVQLLEGAVDLLRSKGAKNTEVAAAVMALGVKLMRAGELRRALAHFREVLRHEPLNRIARQNVAAILWRLEEWQEAIGFFAQERKRFGDTPILLYGHGRSLLEAGDASNAVRPLYSAFTLAGPDDPVRPHIKRYLDRAMASGAPIPPAPALPTRLAPVTTTEIEECLEAFGEFVAASKRMRFWNSVGKHQHEWTPTPEKVAQDLLHTFIKARLGDRVEVIEELHVGAGRLDVLVIAAGGLRTILELKMIGGGRYSAEYAFRGVDQITHYMEQKKCYLGYLLAFDGRGNDFGQGIPSLNTIDECTVHCRFVDVRPFPPSKA